MKLRNKRTGEIADVEIQANCMLVTHQDGRIEQYYFDSIKDLLEWEDYEEPKEYWHIFGTNITKTQECLDELYDKRNKEIGNYFETKEEAEKAVEKLQAFKRLKDKGFSFDSVDRYEALCGNGFNIPITATMPPEAYTDTEVSKDLDICFGE